MKKQFCDICNKPAIEGSVNYKDKSLHKLKCGTEIVVSVHIGFRNHPEGYGGPPDLCPTCLIMLIEDYKKKIKQSQTNDGRHL